MDKQYIRVSHDLLVPNIFGLRFKPVPFLFCHIAAHCECQRWPVMKSIAKLSAHNFSLISELVKNALASVR